MSRAPVVRVPRELGRRPDDTASQPGIAQPHLGKSPGVEPLNGHADEGRSPATHVALVPAVDAGAKRLIRGRAVGTGHGDHAHEQEKDSEPGADASVSEGVRVLSRRR